MRRSSSTVAATLVLAAAGAASATEGVVELDGVSDFLAGQHALALDAMTVEAWVRVDSLTPGVSSGGGVVTSGTGSQNFSLWLFPDNSTAAADWRPGFQVNFANGASAIASVPPGEAPTPFGSWHHVAATYDQSEAVIYIDGLEVLRTMLETPINWQSPSTIAIGNEFPGVSEKLGGEIDEVRIWSRVRTPQEILDTFDVEVCDDPDLWARWSFDDGTAVDVTGQGRDLAPQAGASFGEATVDLTLGDCASCVGDLDATGDVGFNDLLILLTAWGDCSGDCPADLDLSGAVDFDDLLTVLTAWGPCP